MSDIKGTLISEQQYDEIRVYEKSAQFDYEKLKAKYHDPFSDYPTKIDASTDVVIAGGGPSGLMYALYLVQRGFRVIVIEPREIGSTSRDWNIAMDELLQARCILSEEEIAGCIEGCIASRGSIQFRNLFTYRCRDVLDRIVNPEKFLRLLANKIIAGSGRAEEDLFYRTRYENFRVKKDRVCVLTTDGRNVEASLFLHGMGSQDEISRFANHGAKRTWYHAVGIQARIENTIRPAGDFLRTLEDATYGSHKQQIIWELFRSDEPVSDCATIYIFTMEREQMSLTAQMRYFEAHVGGYLQAEVREVHKILYGYIELPDDMTGVKRSIFPRVYSIGENSINSVATGCGFAMCIKNLDHIGAQLVRTLKRGRTSTRVFNAERLNNIKPDMRQLCTVSIEQLFKEMVMRADNEPVDKPNRHSATMFRLFSLVPDEKGRNDMLKCIIRPHLFLPALLMVAEDERFL